MRLYWDWIDLVIKRQLEHFLIVYKWTILYRGNRVADWGDQERTQSVRCFWMSLSTRKITSITVLFPCLTLFQEYSQNGIQQRKRIGRKLSQETGKKAQSAFLCGLMWFGSYHQTAIQQFCFPGCRSSENRCEWVSGPAKEFLVVCQLQWLRLPKKHTACPVLLIRPPHPASNSHAWQKRTIQVLIKLSVGDKL